MTAHRPGGILAVDPGVPGPAVPVALRLAVGEAGPACAAGVDLVDVRRLELAVNRTGRALERRVCSSAERSELPAEPRARLHRLAGIFGVKESVLKALGGIPRGGRFTDICTVRSVERAGAVSLLGETARRAAHLRVRLVAGTAESSAGPDAGLLLCWAVALPEAGR